MTSTSKSPNELRPDLPARRALGAASLLVAAVAVLSYTPTLNTYFNAEDFGVIWLAWNDTFAHWITTAFDDYTQGMWGFRCPSMRPIEALSYLVEARLWAANPVGYHASNSFFHALSSALVLWIAWRLTPAGLAASTVAGLLFAVHAAHVEAVSWIAGRTDLIPTVFILLTVYCFGVFRIDGRTRWRALSLVFAVASFLTKEIAVVVPFLLVGYDALVGRGDDERGWSRFQVHIAYFALLIAYLAHRWIVFGTPLSNWRNPDGAVSRQMISDFLFGQVQLLNLLVFPVNVFETRVDEGWLLLLSVAALLTAAVALWRFRHRAAVVEIRMPCLYFGIVWYVITIAPVIYATTFSRYLYLPSAGVCIAVSLLASRLLSGKVAKWVVAIVVLALMSGLLLQENLRWRRASALSSSLHDEIVRLSAEIPEHSMILLDVPYLIEGIELWQYCVPFALQPPFTPSDLSGRILEKREMYYSEDLWPHERAARISALEMHPTNHFVIRVDAGGKVYSASLAVHEIDDVLRRFRAGGSREEIFRPARRAR